MKKNRSAPATRPVPATNSMVMFLHCRRCLEEKPPGVSPREYARLEVGYTPLGFQVWCMRHEINVMHVDFQGCQHPANLDVDMPSAGVDIHAPAGSA